MEVKQTRRAKYKNKVEVRHLCWRETGDEISVRGGLSRSCGCHGYDRWWGCWCGHRHGDRGLGHHGLLVLGHDGGHGHSQGRQVGHRWGGELTEDLHVHCWEAALKHQTNIKDITFNIFFLSLCQNNPGRREDKITMNSFLYLNLQCVRYFIERSSSPWKIFHTLCHLLSERESYSNYSQMGLCHFRANLLLPFKLC